MEPAWTPRPDVPWFSEDELTRYSRFLTGDAASDRRNFQTLLATVAQVLGEPDFNLLLVKLVDYAIRTANAERGILLLHEEGRLRVRVARNRDGQDLGPDAPLAKTVYELALTSGKPVYEQVSGSHEVLDLSQSVAAMGLRQVMCSPLRTHGKSLGVIYIDSTFSGPRQSEADLMLFHTQAGLMSLAIHNHRLVRDSLRGRATAQQLRVARQIQQRLLPQTPTTYGRVELAGSSEPSDRVGGDYFDYVRLDLDRVGMCVGDVSGHGIGPALIMSNVRAHMRSLLITRRSLGGLYGLLNRALCNDLENGMFVSLFACIYDAQKQVLEYQNAGHPSALLYSPAQDKMTEIGANAPALGIIHDISAGPCPSVRAYEGDFLCCYTDGVSEARSEGGQLFGDDRVKDILRSSVRSGADPDAVVRRIQEAVGLHTDGLPQRDDITILTARL